MALAKPPQAPACSGLAGDGLDTVERYHGRWPGPADHHARSGRVVEKIGPASAGPRLSTTAAFRAVGISTRRRPTFVSRRREAPSALPCGNQENDWSSELDRRFQNSPFRTARPQPRLRECRRQPFARSGFIPLGWRAPDSCRYDHSCRPYLPTLVPWPGHIDQSSLTS